MKSWVMAATGMAAFVLSTAPVEAADQQAAMDATCLILSATPSEAAETSEQQALRTQMLTYFAGKVRARNDRIADALQARPKVSAKEAAVILLACSNDFSDALMDVGANEDGLIAAAKAMEAP